MMRFLGVNQKRKGPSFIDFYVVGYVNLFLQKRPKVL